MFVLNYRLREFLLSAFANRFELKCEPKQLMLLYYKMCPSFLCHFSLNRRLCYRWRTGIFYHDALLHIEFRLKSLADLFNTAKDLGYKFLDAIFSAIVYYGAQKELWVRSCKHYAVAVRTCLPLKLFDIVITIGAETFASRNFRDVRILQFLLTAIL